MTIEIRQLSKKCISQLLTNSMCQLLHMRCEDTFFPYRSTIWTSQRSTIKVILVLSEASKNQSQGKKNCIEKFCSTCKKRQQARRLDMEQKFAHYLSTTIKLFMLIKFKKGIFKLFSVILQKWGLKGRWRSLRYELYVGLVWDIVITW